MVDNKLSMQIHNSFKYKKWRNEIKKRDNRTCICCGIFGDCIQVHHKRSFKSIIETNNITNLNESYACKEFWDIDNGVCLCSCCHMDLHIKLKKGVN